MYLQYNNNTCSRTRPVKAHCLLKIGRVYHTYLYRYCCSRVVLDSHRWFRFCFHFTTHTCVSKNLHIIILNCMRSNAKRIILFSATFLAYFTTVFDEEKFNEPSTRSYLYEYNDVCTALPTAR